MPSGEPLWYCHECHAEMRPLMVPDPVCASCHGSFVEKIENPRDDPRQFMYTNDDRDTPDVDGMDNILFTLQALMDRGMAPGSRDLRRPRPDGSIPGSRLSFQITTGNGTRSMSIQGGPPTMNMPGRAHDNDVPNMSEFIRGPGMDRDRGPISSQLMAQYLLALLGPRDPLSSLLGGLGGMPENGRMGDYVFNQEALDQIITQLMESSNAHRPVPATDEIMNKLPREVLTVESVLLNESCAVCKEQFKLETEDPDEQIVVKLPCKHPFHQPCIMPWLKSSGTCPICRYALVPQPNQPSSSQPGSPAPNSSNRPPSPSFLQRPSYSSDRESRSGGGFIHNIFSHLTGNTSSPSTSTQAASDSNTTAARPRSHYSQSEGERSRSARPSQRDNLPGGWEDDLD